MAYKRKKTYKRRRPAARKKKASKGPSTSQIKAFMRAKHEFKGLDHESEE